MTLLNITIYTVVNAILFFIVVPYIFSCYFCIGYIYGIRI